MRLSTTCIVERLVEDHDGADVAVKTWSDEELVAAVSWADHVIAVAPEAKSEPGGLRDPLAVVEEMRDGGYVPYTIETEGGPIEPELAACRARLRADGWRLVAGRAERQDGGAVLRYLVLAAVRRGPRATIRVRLDAGASRGATSPPCCGVPPPTG